jgi:hypothetical protein
MKYIKLDDFFIKCLLKEESISLKCSKGHSILLNLEKSKILEQLVYL